MAHQLSIMLDAHSEHFIEHVLASGRYASIGDVVREGLQRHGSRLEALRIARMDGERGTPTPLDIETFLAERHAEWQNQMRDRRS